MRVCTNCHAEFAGNDWLCPVCDYLPPSDQDFILMAPALAVGGAGFRPEVFEQLAALEENNFWFRARNKLIIWAIKRYYPSLHNYLEIGCGTGYVLSGIAQAFPSARMVGTEVFSVGLPYAASRVGTAELLQMDARNIPYVDEFDVIGAFDVLEHIEEDEEVLSSMFRALRPGGGIAITVPQHPWLWSTADDHACHLRRYKTGELRQKVQRSGFRIKFETGFVSLPLPAMLTSRLIKNRTKDKGDPLSELKLPDLLNQSFEMIMSIEYWLIKKGLRFNFGGSRILIASKEM